MHSPGLKTTPRRRSTGLRRPLQMHPRGLKTSSSFRRYCAERMFRMHRCGLKTASLTGILMNASYRCTHEVSKLTVPRSDVENRPPSFRTYRRGLKTTGTRSAVSSPRIRDAPPRSQNTHVGVRDGGLTTGYRCTHEVSKPTRQRTLRRRVPLPDAPLQVSAAVERGRPARRGIGREGGANPRQLNSPISSRRVGR